MYRRATTFQFDRKPNPRNVFISRRVPCARLWPSVSCQRQMSNVPSRRDLQRSAAVRSEASSDPGFNRKTRARRILFLGFLCLSFTSAGIYMGSSDLLQSIWVMAVARSDEESLKLYKAPDKFAAQIDDAINSNPLTQKLRRDPSYAESRPHLRFPESHKKHSLTAGALMGPGKMTVPPYVFCSQNELTAISFAGPDLCGHVGIIHGGYLATIVDESFARCAFNSLPNRIGVTANININYRSPAKANSFLAVQCRTRKVEGRKVWVEGTINVLNQDGSYGPVVAQADCLFIEPKYAKMLPQIFQEK